MTAIPFEMNLPWCFNADKELKNYEKLSTWRRRLYGLDTE